MSSNEEYLDNLLKSMMEEEIPQRTFPVDFTTQEEEESESDALTEEEPEPDALTEEEPEPDALIEEEPEPDTLTEEEPESDALTEEESVEDEGFFAMPADNDSNRKMSAEEIEAMFAALEAEDGDDVASMGQEASADAPDQMPEETIDFFAQEEEQQEEPEREAEEEANEEAETDKYAIDEDIMALLDSVSEEGADEDKSPDGEFDFFNMDEGEIPEKSLEAEDEIASLLGDGTEADISGMDLDIDQLLENAETEAAQLEAAQAPQEAGEEETGKKKREKKVRTPREKKKKETGNKKPGFLARLFMALVGDEEEETSETDSIDGYNMDAENRNLMEELGEVSLKQPTGKKEKQKKEKKPKKEKPKKEKKEKKPKKEKPPKEPKQKEPEIPQKKERPLPKKRVAAIVFMGATVLAAILLLTIYLPTVMEGRQAEQAYAEKNYEEAFYLLQGKELNAEEKKLYRKTLLILQLERQLESYENYREMDKPLEALNALVKGVDKYQKGHESAVAHGVENETNNIYLDIMTILQTEYGLTEDGVRKLLEQKDDVYYTIGLKEVLGEAIPGRDLGEIPAEETVEETDLLPEEELLEQ